MFNNALAFSCINTGVKLAVEKTKKGVTVTEGGKGVLFYQFMPQSVNGLYTRAGFVHPLFDLWGDTLIEIILNKKNLIIAGSYKSG